VDSELHKQFLQAEGRY